MQSRAQTVAAYLESVPAERRRSMERVIGVVRANLDPLLEEGMQYGMIGWYVPHSVFAPGYHCDPAQPLPYACLASQKNHMSLYLMTAYAGGSACAAVDVVTAKLRRGRGAVARWGTWRITCDARRCRGPEDSSFRPLLSAGEAATSLLLKR